MRLSRIYTAQQLTVGDTVELEGQAGHYLARVLRLSVGDSVTLFNGNGEDYLGRVRERYRQRILVSLSDSKIPGTESALRITLVQSISRGGRMDYTVQKAVELGVYAIQPLFASRVEGRLDAKRWIKRLAHWRRVAISACEQSGRAVVPQILDPLLLGDWLAGEADRQQWVLVPQASSKLTTCIINGKSISLLVGPEGGFSDEELGLVTAKGVVAVSLGPRILRTESAGPAAIAVLQAMAGDF